MPYGGESKSLKYIPVHFHKRGHLYWKTAGQAPEGEASEFPLSGTDEQAAAWGNMAMVRGESVNDV